MISREVFKPISDQIVDLIKTGNPNTVGAITGLYTANGDLPEFEEAKIAIIGVPEYRGAGYTDQITCNLDDFREKFYQLKAHRVPLKIVDFGDVIPGNSLSDTYHLLTKIGSELIRSSVIPLFIGGSHDLTIAMYRSFAELEQVINVVNIDSRFDLGNPDEPLNSDTWLGHIVLQNPNYLFNYSNLGYQTYFVGNEAVSLMEKLYFEAFRLGELRTDITEIEPMIRAADLVTIDLTSIKQSDAPGTTRPSPNGFAGDEICQAMMYAGLSDRVSSIGLFEFKSNDDRNHQTAHLIGQMIWYFLEGVSLRKNDFPGTDHTGFTKYQIAVSEGEDEMVFLKNSQSGRWWIEVPLDGKNSRFNRHNYLPCSIRDYQQACKNEVPERWWQAIHKIY
jgi:arginase family enzyme